MKLHPDVNSAPDAKQQFIECKTAYETLSDVQQRAAYDRSRKGGMGGAGLGGDFGADWEEFGRYARCGLPGRQPRQPRPPRPRAKMCCQYALLYARLCSSDSDCTAARAAFARRCFSPGMLVDGTSQHLSEPCETPTMVDCLAAKAVIPHMLYLMLQHVYIHVATK
jgi:curved DNA-binding protein CbpA